MIKATIDNLYQTIKTLGDKHIIEHNFNDKRFIDMLNGVKSEVNNSLPKNNYNIISRIF